MLFALLAVLPFSAQAQMYEGCTYETQITHGDKFNSSGVDLRKLKGRAAVAAILRQNRANTVKAYGLEGSDACLASKSDRALFEKLILNSRITTGAANTIIHGTPRIRVDLSVGPRGEDLLEVQILRSQPSYRGVVH